MHVLIRHLKKVIHVRLIWIVNFYFWDFVVASEGTPDSGGVDQGHGEIVHGDQSPCDCLAGWRCYSHCARPDRWSTSATTRVDNPTLQGQWIIFRTDPFEIRIR